MLCLWNLVTRSPAYNFIKVTAACTWLPREAWMYIYISLVHKLQCWVKMPLENISFTQQTEMNPKELFQSSR